MLSSENLSKRPFAQSGYMVGNKLFWDESHTVGIYIINKGTHTSPARLSYAHIPSKTMQRIYLHLFTRLRYIKHPEVSQIS